MQDYPVDMFYQTNGNCFLYSRDLALCMLISTKNQKLKHLNLADNFDIRTRMPIDIAGYPKPQRTFLFLSSVFEAILLKK